MYPLELLPDEIRALAYRAGAEAAWPRDTAIEVIEHLTAKDAAVEGLEIWLPTVPGPTIPMPFVYVWTVGERVAGEDWSGFVRRANASAVDYITNFAWDQADTGHHGMEPYFNLSILTEREA
jgi:hypothetical protein